MKDVKVMMKRHKRKQCESRTGSHDRKIRHIWPPLFSSLASTARACLQSFFLDFWNRPCLEGNRTRRDLRQLCVLATAWLQWSTTGSMLDRQTRDKWWAERKRIKRLKKHVSQKQHILANHPCSAISIFSTILQLLLSLSLPYSSHWKNLLPSANSYNFFKTSLKTHLQKLFF